MPRVENAEPFLLRQVKAVHPTVPRSRTIAAGLVAGEVAGVAMALTMCGAFHFAMGRSPFLPFDAIGATVLGVTNAGGVHPALALFGFAIHMLVPSLAWGLAYGVLVATMRPTRATALLFLGLATGVIAQLVDVHLLAPILDAHGVIVDRYSATVHPVWSWLFHLVFGVGLSLHPWTYDAEMGRFV